MIIAFIAVLLLSFSAIAAEGTLPEALFYKGKPVPDYYSFRFVYDAGPVCLDDTSCEADIDYQWEYLGSYYGKYHLIKTYYWETYALGKFTHLLLVKREGDDFEVSDVINGGDRHASMIFSADVSEDKVTYWQGATSGSLLDYARTLFPDIDPLLARSLIRGCYGEACYYGTYKFAAHVIPEGKFINHGLCSFEACEGDPYYGKEYSKEELKTFILDMLYEFDKDKPEAFKDNGVAFSPVCFYRILKEDLEDVDTLPRYTNISSDKDSPACLVSGFNWDYIGKTDQFHLISASDGKSFGIYTIRREGNQLIKMGRLFHEEKNDLQAVFEPKVEGDSLVFFQKVSTQSLFNLFCEKFPELKPQASQKVWSSLGEDLPCGLAKMEVRISGNGQLDQKTLIGFMSSGDPLKEEREEAARKKELLPMDKTLLFTGIEMSNPYEFDRLLSEKQLEEFFQTALKRALER